VPAGGTPWTEKRFRIGKDICACDSLVRAMEYSRAWPAAANGARLKLVVFSLLALYFMTNMLLRVAVSPSLGFDESEMALVSQELAWGYKTPPPLYPWLQSACFRLFGVSVFSLALLKNLILFGVYLSLYGCAKHVLKDENISLIASLSLFLIPTFVWEALRSQAHSVLATLMAGLTLLCTLRLLKTPSTANYCGLGLSAALGILSYYNFAAFAAALGLGCLSTPLGRKRLLDGRVIPALFSFLILVVPHGFWLRQHRGYVSEVVRKLDPDVSQGFLTIASTGIGHLLIALLSFLGPLLLCYYWLFKRPDPFGSDPETRLFSTILGRTLAVVLILCFLVVVATGATRFKDRWLEPVLFFVPIYFLSLVKGPVTAPTFKRFAIVSGLSSILALTILHARVPLAGANGVILPLHYPAADMAAEIRKAGFTGGTIVAENKALGANLRLYFRDSDLIVPLLTAGIPSGGRPLLVVWEGSRSRAMPPALAEFVTKNFEVDLTRVTPRVATATYFYTEGKQAALAFAQPASR
jgi:4-amino-4-deoxy-L-arabinose transferase-like glycosyltransferase